MEENNKDQKLGFLNLFVVILTVYVLGAILIDTFFKLPLETSRILRIIDDVICVFFLLEFLISFPDRIDDFFKLSHRVRFEIFHGDGVALVSGNDIFYFPWLILFRIKAFLGERLLDE